MIRQSTRTKPMEIRLVEQFGDVGCGRVVEFTPREGLVPIVVPSNAPSNEFLGTMVVRGPSLENDAIYDGDILLCRRNFTKRDISPDTVCIVFIRLTGELVAKKVIHTNDVVTLRSSGGGIKDVYYKPDDIEIRGIVFGFQRMQNEFGRFRRDSDEDIPN